MSVPAREVPASPRRVTLQPSIPLRPATRRRAGSLVLIGAIVAQLTMLTLPLAASAPPIVAAAQPAPETITLVSGGIAGEYGTADPNVTYSIGAYPGTTTPASAFLVAPNAAYTAAIDGARWVNTTGSPDAPYPESSTITYSIPFTLPAGFSAPSISVQLLADNAGTVYLNGNPIGQQTQEEIGSNFQSIATFNSSAAVNFQIGTNTLSITNRNFSGPEGIDFKAVVTYNPNLVTNGSFEVPTTVNTGFDTYGAGSTAIDGWTVGGGSIDHIKTYWPASDGVQSIDLDGNVPGSMTQTLATVPGAHYRLTYAYSANPDRWTHLGASAASPSMDVLWGTSIVDPHVTHGITTLSGMSWTSKEVFVTAIDSSTALSFVSTDVGTAYGIALDDVSVVPVSAPPTVDGPVLTAIYSDGVDTFYAGNMPAVAGESYELTFASASTCPGGVIDPEAATFATETIMAPADGGSEIAFIGKLVDSVPDAGNQYVAARVSGPDGKHSEYSPCIVDGPDNDTWPRARLVDLDGPADAEAGAASGFLDVPGRERWFKFTVQPGARVQVSLTGFPEDYDLVLFKDIGKTYNELVNPASTDDLTKLGAEFASSGFTSSGFTSSGFTSSGFTSSGFTDSVYSSSGFTSSGFTSSGFTSSGFTSSGFTSSGFTSSGFTSSGFTSSGFTSSGFTSSGFTDEVISSSGFTSSGFTSSGFTDAFSGAQTRSLVAISANAGNGDELVAANTWTNTGEYYIRVSGKNGVSSADAPFHLAITQNGGQCGSVGPTAIASTTVPGAGSYQSIILTDSSRLPASSLAEQTALQGKLATFASRGEVQGVVVDLADDARINALNSQADANPSCVYAKNLVAESIRDVVTGYRTLNSATMQYVVLVGGDDVIPFFRYPDNSDLGPEAAYVPPVKSDSASEASLRYNYVLSQDAYGAGIQISLYASDFPIPDMAVGRLVENASEVSGMLDAYTATNGVVVPDSSLVTGYDFLEDAARAAEVDLSAGTGAAADTLIAPFNIAPTDPASWTATQLKTKLLGTRHDLVFLAGHFSANSALAADFTTSLLTTDLTSSTLDQSNVIVLSIGCHSGYNIVDGAAVQNITQPLDWPQAFAQKQMTGILGTGYQYGDTDFIEYSERIYTEVARQLRYGSGPVSIGKALVEAKLDYLQATPDIRGLHEKALREATLYGLPMLGVNLPSGRGLSDPSDATIGALAGYNAEPWNPGHELELRTADVSIDPSLTPHPVTLKQLGGGDDLIATWFSGPDGVVTNPGEPALPLDSVNVGQDGYVLRGVGFFDGTYSDQTVVPLNGAPATELKAAHTPFTSSTFLPARMWTPNYYGALSQAGGTRLLVTPAQHRAINPGEAEVTLRTYSHLGLKLFFSNSTEDGAGSEAPSISDVAATVAGNEVTFSARAVGDPRAGIQEVWVTYTGLDTMWHSTLLEQDGTDSSLWTKTVTLPAVAAPTQLDFMVQAANGFGLVGISDDRGAYHKAIVGSGTPPAETSLALGATPTGGAYGSIVSVSATLSGPGSGDGKPVVFKIGNATKTGLTVSGVASTTMQLTANPGQALLTASFAGDLTSLPSATSRPITITSVGTSLTLTPASSTILLGADSGVTATLKDALDNPLANRSIYLLVSGPGGAITRIATTDFAGRAFLGVLPSAVGFYSVTACFNGPASPALCSGYGIPDGTYLPSGSTATIQQIWPFTGFFQPVDNLPTLNLATGGSAIPIKFSLGGNRGLNILATGTPVSPGIVQIACASTAVLDTIETVLPTTTAGGVQYDATSNQYTYVWKTAKTYATKCYQFQLRLMDGKIYYANFKFK